MNYSTLTKNIKTNELRFTNTKQPIILHIIPDFDTDVADSLFTNGIDLINCYGMVSQSKSIKLGIKTFNTRRIFLNTKNKLENKEVVNASKAIQVFQEYPKDLDNHLINNKSFIITDHTVLSQACKYIVKQTNEKNGLFFLLQHLKNEINLLKKQQPTCENLILFSLNQTLGLGNVVYNLIHLFFHQ